MRLVKKRVVRRSGRMAVRMLMVVGVVVVGGFGLPTFERLDRR